MSPRARVQRALPALLLLLAAPAPAQPQFLPVEKVFDGRGLPQSSVRAVCRDESGFLWIGCQEGLLRYDGYRFTPSALADEGAGEIAALCPDGAGGLWIGRGAGLLRFHPASGRTRSKDLPSPGAVRALARDRLGRIWIGGDFGLLRCRPDGGGAVSIRLARPGAGVTAILAAPDRDELWVAAGAGFFRLQEATGSWEEVTPAPGEWSGARPTGLALLPGQGRELLLATDRGLYRLDLRRRLAAPFVLNLVNQDTMLGDEAIRTLYRDDQDILWIGYDFGLVKYAVTTKDFRLHLPHGTNPPHPRFNLVTTVQERGPGELLVTTFGGGALLFDRAAQRFRPIRLDPLRPQRPLNNFIIDAIAEPDGGFTFMTPEGPARCDSSLRLLAVHPLPRPDALADHFFLMTRDSRGFLWICSDKGVARLAPNGEWTEFHHDDRDPRSLSHDRANGFFEDAEGAVWIATDDGLNRFRYGVGGFDVYRHDPADGSTPASNLINQIHSDRSGRIWLCTADGLSQVTREAGRIAFRKFRASGYGPDHNSFRCLV